MYVYDIKINHISTITKTNLQSLQEIPSQLLKICYGKY